MKTITYAVLFVTLAFGGVAYGGGTAKLDRGAFNMAVQFQRCAGLWFTLRDEMIDASFEIFEEAQRRGKHAQIASAWTLYRMGNTTFAESMQTAQRTSGGYYRVWSDVLKNGDKETIEAEVAKCRSMMTLQRELVSEVMRSDDIGVRAWRDYRAIE